MLGQRIAEQIIANWFAFVAILVVLTTGAWGQENATITGTVDGLKRRGGRERRTHTYKSFHRPKRETVSNGVGAYRFVNVGVGTYTLTATAPGFQKYTRTGIVVNVARPWKQTLP